MRHKAASAALVAGMAVLAGPASAHHSFSMFDMNKTVAVTGTVTEFRWTNPHAWLHLDVPGAGGATDAWAVEMTSPNNLVKTGWRRSSLKLGDKVKVNLHPLVNGKKGGSLANVTLANGQTLENK